MVSVIIPIYKVENYLRQCVDSVLAQTYTDLEIILVDDGSPDQCGAICDEYAAKDARIKVIHKENGGLSDARNAGLDIATGEYIYFLDSDDYIDDDAIERLVAFADSENADIVGLNLRPFSEEDGFRINEDEELILYPVGTGAKNVLLRFEKEHAWFPGAPLQFYRAEYLRKENLRFRKGILFEDLLFNGIAYVRASKVSPINRFLYHYRLRSGSILNNGVTAKALQSYHLCAQGFIEEKAKYPEGSEQECALDHLAVFAAKKYIEDLLRFKFSERFGFVRESRLFAKRLKSVRTIDCRRLRLKLKHIILWSAFRVIMRR